MSKKWARLAREQVGYGLVGRDARATVTSSTGETVTRGPVQGVRVEEKPDRMRLPDFETGKRHTYIKVEVQINGEWFLVSKVEVKRPDFAQSEDAQDRELLDAVPVRVNGGQVFHVDRKTGKRIAPEDEARAFREDAAALQVTRDLLTGKDEQLKNWMDDQSDDVRRAVIRALRVEQLKGQHPSNGEAR